MAASLIEQALELYAENLKLIAEKSRYTRATSAVSDTERDAVRAGVATFATGNIAPAQYPRLERLDRSPAKLNSRLWEMRAASVSPVQELSREAAKQWHD